MNRAQIKTDNSYFEQKVVLRKGFLPFQKRVKVLDCFAGEQRIWSYIKEQLPNVRFEIIPIDRKNIAGKIYLQGDNRKFLPSFDLDTFDIIDLDAYGISFDILDYCLKHSTRPVIFLTFIQTLFGCLPTKFLEAIGYTKQMIRKCPTLFYSNAIGKLKEYLSMYPDISKICYYETGRKYYIAIIRKNGGSA